jgi:CO/xanthine dehydrogenase Mo-binding subunit
MLRRMWVGKNVPRKEGVDKVTGRATYVDDLTFPGMLHGVTVRSPVPRGRILGVHFDPGVPWDEIVVATAADIPGENTVKLIDVDQPLLADGEVRHCEEPILLLAHPDRQVAEKARRCVRLDIERLPSVHTIEDALAGKVVIWGEDNVFTRYRVDKGDVEAAFARADHIVEGVYTTGAQEQMYIEPQGMIAIWDPQDGLTVYGSLQCPFYVQTALGPPFALPPEKLRVVQQTTGGGFGGKEEYPSIIAGHAALLAKKAGRPVKLIYDRIEDVAASTKRHPSRTRHRTAVAADGTLLAMEIEFVIDGGAYKTLSPVVLSRGTIHAAGPYRCENVRIEAKAVATSTPPHGAFRGFGAPQSIFALERHLDRVAEVVGLDPIELRRRNLLRPGDITAVDQVIDEPIDLEKVVDTALQQSGYTEKRRRFAELNAAGGPIRKGIGAAVFYHGAGFTGSGEVTLASVVGVRASADGRLTVLAASTEIGQGTNTIFSQIAADAAGIDPDRVELVQPDTLAVPDSGPTVASRTTMVVGGLVDKATRNLVARLREAGLDPEQDFATACHRYLETHDELSATAKYDPPRGAVWDHEKFRGTAYARYAWAAYVAEVTVDLRTCEVQVDDFVAVQEIGKTVNPVLAAGQIEGGVAQAVGWALYEDVVWRDGAVVNPQMTNYIIPTAVDTPPIRVVFVEPFEGQAAAPKGIGELPMDGPAPAIIAAVEQAVGVPLDRVPLLPEALLDCMEDHRRESA